MYKLSKNKNKNIHKNEVQNIGFGNSKSKKKKFKSVQKQQNWTFVVLTVIWGKYNIGFVISMKFPSQRKKNSNRSINRKLDCCGPESHPGVDYRVALLFTRYLTALGIIPESLKSIGQF